MDPHLTQITPLTSLTDYRSKMAITYTNDQAGRGRQQCDTELVPGTEIMMDHDDINFVHAHNSSSSAVLVPQPTNDRHDPLVSQVRVSESCGLTQLV